MIGILVLGFVVSYAQQKKPIPHLGSAPLSSSCIVANLPPDKPDSSVREHSEPADPDKRDPRFFLHKRRLPNSTWSNYFEDLGRNTMNKTNSGDLQLGASGKFTVYTQGTPPDNTMAISNAGKIAASINVKIGFYDSTGTRSSTAPNDLNISTFINDPLLTQSELFDPRIIYDAKSDRFIYVVLSGSTDIASKVVIGFSQTNNPQGAWKFYKLSGNFDGSSSWFDYPNIAVTDNELIITGNLFLYPDNSFNQVIILQINKAEGYSGAANLNYKYWDGIQDGTGNSAFTLVPAVNGSNDSYGPHVYLVSNTPPSGNIITFYEITDLWNVSTSQINIMTATVDMYSTPTADAQQLNPTRRLDIKKNRIRNAFFANGILHYTMITPTNSFGSVSAIAYGRYDVATNFNKLIYVGEAGFNFAFPSIMHFSNLEHKNTTLVTYLVSNKDIYPEIRALTIDENMVPSSSILIKAGTGFVNYGFGGSSERWGDYTTLARKYNSTKPEAWVFGCYGETNHNWGNFIAQITATQDIAPPEITLDTFYFSPNPTMRYINLNIATIDTATFQLKIYSLKGQLVREEMFLIPKGKHSKTFDLSGLAPEEYILRLAKNNIDLKPTKIILLGK